MQEGVLKDNMKRSYVESIQHVFR